MARELEFTWPRMWQLFWSLGWRTTIASYIGISSTVTTVIVWNAVTGGWTPEVPWNAHVTQLLWVIYQFVLTWVLVAVAWRRALLRQNWREFRVALVAREIEPEAESPHDDPSDPWSRKAS